MGIQVQPCCCGGQWVAISDRGWMYDLNIRTGALTRPRNFGVARNPATGQGGLYCLAQKPGNSGVLYSHQQALTSGSVSNLYRLSIDGTATLIGPLRDAPALPDPAWDWGISAGGNCMDGLNTNQIYASSWNGLASRNSMMMTIDVADGLAFPAVNNFDGSGPQTGGVGHITSNIFGMVFSPLEPGGIDQFIFAIGSKATNPITGPPAFQDHFQLGQIDPNTGIFANLRPFMNPIANGFYDLKWYPSLKYTPGESLAGKRLYGVNKFVFYIDDMATGEVKKGPAITGFQDTTNERLTGLAFVETGK